MAKGMVSTYGEREGFYKFLSLQAFQKPLDELGLIQKLKEQSQPLCFLVDEFQYIFDSNALHDVAKDFFRTLSSFKNISYIAVGTYCIVDLLTSDGSTFVLPFNKAKFLPMPLFEYHEMGEIFELYK